MPITDLPNNYLVPSRYLEKVLKQKIFQQTMVTQNIFIGRLKTKPQLQIISNY